jgi:hypothetical protein
MPDIKTEGVDNLQITEHVMSQSDVTSHCSEAMGIPTFMALLVMPLACATIVLETWTCDIYYAKVTESLTLEHERLHCAGYWHDNLLQEYYNKWRGL